MTPTQQKYAIQRIVTVAIARLKLMQRDDHNLSIKQNNIRKVTVADVKDLPIRPDADLTAEASLSALYDLTAVHQVKKEAEAAFKAANTIPGSYSKQITLTHPVTGKSIITWSTRFTSVYNDAVALQKRLDDVTQDIMLNDDDGAVRALIEAF